jgi:hypothetical protein
VAAGQPNSALQRSRKAAEDSADAAKFKNNSSPEITNAQAHSTADKVPEASGADHSWKAQGDKENKAGASTVTANTESRPAAETVKAQDTQAKAAELSEKSSMELSSDAIASENVPHANGSVKAAFTHGSEKLASARSNVPDQEGKVDNGDETAEDDSTPKGKSPGTVTLVSKEDPYTPGAGGYHLHDMIDM